MISKGFLRAMEAEAAAYQREKAQRLLGQVQQARSQCLGGGSAPNKVMMSLSSGIHKIMISLSSQLPVQVHSLSWSFTLLAVLVIP